MNQQIKDSSFCLRVIMGCQRGEANAPFGGYILQIGQLLFLTAFGGK